MAKLLRTKTAGTKLSEDEYAQVEAGARKRDMTVSEWCRDVLLSNVGGQPANPAQGGTDAQALMAELVALRTILLDVLYQQANGETLTTLEMRNLINRANADKLKKALERFKQATETTVE